MGGYIYGHFVYCFPLIRSTGKAGFFIEDVVKRCSKCGIEKQDIYFRCYKKTIGTSLEDMCISCRGKEQTRISNADRYKLMTKEEKETIKARQRVWKLEHKERCKEYEKTRIRTNEQVVRKKQRHKERYLEVKSDPVLYGKVLQKRNERYREKHPAKIKTVLDIIMSKEKARIAKNKEHERYRVKYPGKIKDQSKKAREKLTDAYIIDTLKNFGFPEGYKNKDIIDLQRSRLFIKRALKQRRLQNEANVN
jgi:hypothetical protein